MDGRLLYGLSDYGRFSRAVAKSLPAGARLATHVKMIPNWRRGSCLAHRSGSTAQSVVMAAETIEVDRAKKAAPARRIGRHHVSGNAYAPCAQETNRAEQRAAGSRVRRFEVEVGGWRWCGQRCDADPSGALLRCAKPGCLAVMCSLNSASEAPQGSYATTCPRSIFPCHKRWGLHTRAGARGRGTR